MREHRRGRFHPGRARRATACKPIPTAAPPPSSATWAATRCFSWASAFRAEELSALVLRSLKEDAEAALGQPVTDCIITVPAYFSDAQRKATRAMLTSWLSLRVDRLLNEPTAAALAYGVHLRDSESRFLVFDLGGGTFDVSLLDLFENVMEVRASVDDNFLGGEDFTARLVEHFCEHCAVPPALRKDAQFQQRLSAQAELAKRSLTGAAAATIRIAHGKHEFSMDLDEATLEQLCAPLLARLRDPVERALRDAVGMPIADLDRIVLAGGATRMPLVRRLVARMFGRLPACDINPDEVVALGAAVQAGLRSKDAALDEVVMTDVSPYSLGIDTSMEYDVNQYSHGHFDSIIERNSVVPLSRTKRYYPVRDHQRTLEINVYQGEARMASDNIWLGQLNIPLLYRHARRERRRRALHLRRQRLAPGRGHARQHGRERGAGHPGQSRFAVRAGNRRALHRPVQAQDPSARPDRFPHPARARRTAVPAVARRRARTARQPHHAIRARTGKPGSARVRTRIQAVRRHP
ncbi:Hsp70 family protein [Massilia sp. H-1]|nr:Hsp70 family protein [Massilia sp. H-1]